MSPFPSGPYLRGVFTGSTPPPRNVNRFFFNKYRICLYSKVVYEDARKQAPRGEIAATRYVSELKKCPKCVCGRGSAPDPAGEAYSAPPDPLAGNEGGVPRRGRKKERRGREGKGRRGMGREGEELSPRTKILATALISIPILVQIQFPLPQESHGNPIPTGTPIPMHTSQWDVKPTVPFYRSS